MIRSNVSSSFFKRIHIHASPLYQHNARFSRSTVVAAQGAKVSGQAPTSSKRPKEHTHLEQNLHLKHAASGEGGNKGRDKAPTHSNAAEDPKLPSHKFDGGKAKKSSSQHGKRGLHWSAVWSAEGGKAGSDGHSADSYFKDVDTSEPATNTTYSVSGDDATKAHRPNEQYADPKKQYATVSKEEPYQPPTSEAEHGGKDKDAKESNLRYGGTEKDSEKGTSHSKESAAEGNAGGRKPEGRK
ncbi:hypothetical protein SCHPADRAFT_871796 [Schizopora paradoxa]|uniref:Uncharacterized protein n=1 Tax=Schizopora paradoxa TaxID=27342 RepID=A0A0H2SDC9_9AGAM|nr:hypothetical protein SCHPADRAFT_871796 [Schizopora paradoxa]